MTIEQRLECLERRSTRYVNVLLLLVMSVCTESPRLKDLS